MSELEFFVFSYNRGQFLANCVRSIEECAPGCAVTVIDDQSLDPATQVELAEIESRHRVIHSGLDSGHKHGGLYGNMQTVLELAPADTVACFLQDDTQLVRALDPGEPQAIADRFLNCPTLGFISPCFVRERTWQRSGGMTFTYDRGLDLFFPEQTGRSAGIHYSDVVMAHVGRLRSVGWQFAKGEPANQAAARHHFRSMGYLRTPFAMWLPNVPAYRGRTKSLSLRWAERLRRCGFHPLRYITTEAVERMEQTNADHPPIAEQWLTAGTGYLQAPWIYDPLQGSRWLKHIHSLELAIRRLGR